MGEWLEKVLYQSIVFWQFKESNWFVCAHSNLVRGIIFLEFSSFLFIHAHKFFYIRWQLVTCAASPHLYVVYIINCSFTCAFMHVPFIEDLFDCVWIKEIGNN
jgi:hypothetical protein